MGHGISAATGKVIALEALHEILSLKDGTDARTRILPSTRFSSSNCATTLVELGAIFNFTAILASCHLLMPTSCEKMLKLHSRILFLVQIARLSPSS